MDVVNFSRYKVRPKLHQEGCQVGPKGAHTLIAVHQMLVRPTAFPPDFHIHMHSPPHDQSLPQHHL